MSPWGKSRSSVTRKLDSEMAISHTKGEGLSQNRQLSTCVKVQGLRTAVVVETMSVVDVDCTDGADRTIDKIVGSRIAYQIFFGTAQGPRRSPPMSEQGCWIGKKIR